MKFVITGLPRTRSAWFAAYFTNGSMRCYHEPIPHGIILQSNEGAADTGYMISPDWANAIGEHELILIHRHPDQVRKSLKKLGLIMSNLDELARRLYDFKGLHILFHDIDQSLPKIHKYLDIPYDKARATLFTQMNIQNKDYYRAR